MSHQIQRSGLRIFNASIVQPTFCEDRQNYGRYLPLPMQLIDLICVLPTFEIAGLTSQADDIHKADRPSEINCSRKKDGGFQQFSNPFNSSLHQSSELFCLSSDQPASEIEKND